MNYVKGDATNPVGEGHKFIIHCCNDVNKWGAGFVLALTKKWPWVENHYRTWHKKGELFRHSNTVKVYTDDASGYGFHLGAIQVVDVSDDISVVNMIGQHSCGPDSFGHPPVRYYAIEQCLKKLKYAAKERNATIHLPYLMCCGLAGGSWDLIETMLDREFPDVDVTAYEFVA